MWRSRTRYTTPNVPLPICRSLVYCWRFRSDVGVGSKGAMVCLGGPSARVAELKVMEVTQQATGRAAVRPCQSVSSGESTSHTVTRVASNMIVSCFVGYSKKRKRMPFSAATIPLKQPQHAPIRSPPLSAAQVRVAIWTDHSSSRIQGTYEKAETLRSKFQCQENSCGSKQPR